RGVFVDHWNRPSTRWNIAADSVADGGHLGELLVEGHQASILEGPEVILGHCGYRDVGGDRDHVPVRYLGQEELTFARDRQSADRASGGEQRPWDLSVQEARHRVLAVEVDEG